MSDLTPTPTTTERNHTMMTVQELYDLVVLAVDDALTGVVHTHDRIRVADKTAAALEVALDNYLVHDEPGSTEPDDVDEVV